MNIQKYFIWDTKFYCSGKPIIFDFMSHFEHYSEENYLKMLYKLGSKDLKKVNNTALSKALELNPATVLEMVRKLKEKKLVAIGSDKAIQLTDKGKKKALLIIRKHRLWEVFLVEKLQFKWNEVHMLAEQLEHIESDDLVDRLEKFLGHPDFDPHGDPIPDKTGKIKINQTIPLVNSQPGENVKVISFAETNDAFLDYLGKLNIKPGIKIKVTDIHEYDQSLSVLIQKKAVQLSEKAARNILVENID